MTAFTYDEPSDSFTCPQGQTLKFVRIQHTNGVPLRLYRASGAVCQGCPAFGVCTRAKEIGRSLAVGPHDAVLRRHRAWMSTSAAREAYKLRKQLVEPVFGIIKEQQGARRFLLRGLTSVAAEWTMLATAFNLRTLWRAWRSSAFVQLPHGAEPLPDPNCASNHPSLTHRHLQLSRQKSLSKPHWPIPTAPTCYPLHHFWDRLNCELFAGRFSDPSPKVVSLASRVQLPLQDTPLATCYSTSCVDGRGSSLSPTLWKRSSRNQRRITCPERTSTGRFLISSRLGGVSPDSACSSRSRGRRA